MSLRLQRIAMLVAAVGMGACAAPTPPETPSWEADVFPILRGNCLHCHGETAETTAMLAAWRFDVCNKAAAPFKTVGIGPVTDTVQHMSVIMLAVTPMNGKRPAMPPAPAAPLADYEVAILKNWQKVVMKDAAAACRKHGNRPPTARVVRTHNDTGGYEIVVDLVDPDGDAIFGRARGSRGMQDVTAPGRTRFTVAAGPEERILLELTDGYDVVPLQLP